jgi:hypothetical protein
MKLLPMNPAPPVTRIVFPASIRLSLITGFFFLVLLFSAGYYFKIREITGTFRRLLQKAI